MTVMMTAMVMCEIKYFQLQKEEMADSSMTDMSICAKVQH
jgi:hypothetical protein